MDALSLQVDRRYARVLRELEACPMLALRKQAALAPPAMALYCLIWPCIALYGNNHCSAVSPPRLVSGKQVLSHLGRVATLCHRLGEEVDYKGEAARLDLESLLLAPHTEPGEEGEALPAYGETSNSQQTSRMKSQQGSGGGGRKGIQKQGSRAELKGKAPRGLGGKAGSESYYLLLPKIRTELDAAEGMQGQIKSRWSEYDALEQGLPPTRVA